MTSLGIKPDSLNNILYNCEFEIYSNEFFTFDPLRFLLINITSAFITKIFKIKLFPNLTPITTEEQRTTFTISLKGKLLDVKKGVKNETY